MEDCTTCGAICYELEEYCHVCGDLTCHDCLEDEACPCCAIDTHEGN